MASETTKGFAIINPYGGVWTNKLFDSPAEAKRYLMRFWSGNFKPQEWAVAKATMTIKLDKNDTPVRLDKALAHGEQP